MRRLLLAAVAVVSLAPLEAGATPMLDQFCCIPAGGRWDFGNFTRVQTFTVGTAGQLTRIDLAMQPAGGVLPTIHLFAGAFVHEQGLEAHCGLSRIFSEDSPPTSTVNQRRYPNLAP